MIGATGRGLPELKLDALKEALTVFKDEILSDVYVGWVKGYLDDERAKLEAFAATDAGACIKVSHPREAFKAVAEALRKEKPIPGWIELQEAIMRVLKVVAEGLTTSFRYPHFMQQIHPSFPMPPPATIYGHICSALGEWFDPTGVRFAYHFTHEGAGARHRAHHRAQPIDGKLPDTEIPKVLEGNVNPFEREIFFRPRLTLYINRPEWEPAFRSPRYAVVLGRSQDLFTYTSVSLVELGAGRKRLFRAHARAARDGVADGARRDGADAPLSRSHSNRAPTFERYVVVQERVVLPDDELPRFSHLSYGPYWVDPTPHRQGYAARSGLSEFRRGGAADAARLLARLAG